MIYSNKMKYPKYYWLNEDTPPFIKRIYIKTPEQRIKDIERTAEVFEYQRLC
ncbi:MAG: hypothetical protein CM15mV42_1280 [uncultured marine virus]|nr:MAG: hypothetical protein CM15mV42_1280 [uncultured marine virus]